MKVLTGKGIGKQGILSTGCSATLFDGQKILLTRRADNHRWCLPGGQMEAGESVAQCCEREVLEETGLVVQVKRLLGIYSSPDFLLEYADGNRRQIVGLNFLVEAVGGTLGLSTETTAYGYFSLAESEHMDIVDHHIIRLRDAFAAQPMAYVR